MKKRGQIGPVFVSAAGSVFRAGIMTHSRSSISPRRYWYISR